ncbi:MAG TPA: hypothetical protein VHG72_21770 [Polyangia bacterium]|nr:hypothetical protein [Polyangia bacterium]
MTAAKPRSESEVNLCDRLRAWAEGLGFEVYPEVSGWDLVLVCEKPTELERHGTTIQPGEQVGIHAKLRPSCEVLMQAAPGGDDDRGPRYPFVAVPRAGRGFKYIARRLGLGVIEADAAGKRLHWNSPERERVIKISEDARPRRVDILQLKLPPVASRAIVAGAPSPRVLSEWRVKALRFLAFARSRSTFRCSDLVGFGLSKTWLDRWGDPVDWTTETRRGKTVRVRTYKLTEKPENLPDWGYTDVAAEMLAVEPAPPRIEEASPATQLALPEEASG